MEINVFDSVSDDEIRFRMHNLRRQKVFKERINYFDTLPDDEFIKRFRLTKANARRILEQIHEEIDSTMNFNNKICAETKLLLALRFYATGTMLLAIADFVGVSKTSACGIIRVVTYAIARLRPQYVYMPRNDEELQQAKLQFYRIARFPNVIGAIDCTHVRIQSYGGDDAELFRNRHGYLSWNVQVVGDSNLKFLDIVARWPGSAHDQTIFNASSIKTAFENGNFNNSVLLGDSGYAVKNYLLRPYANPRTRAERLFNESQIRSRNSVERLFGVWKRRFPVIFYGLRANPELSKVIIVTVAVLHNIAIVQNYGMIEEIEVEINEEIANENEDVPDDDNAYRLYLTNVHFPNL